MILPLISILSISCDFQDNKDGNDYQKIGKLKPRSANEIDSSPISIGGETLDRDYADYHQYKKYLGPLGAKKIRLQAGWAKTEKEKGIYDWEWLDAIIDDAISQGVAPWLQASYGNPIYDGGGGKNLGAGIPNSSEALTAWDNWVRTMATRYGDKVKIWEVWNEGDGKRNSDPQDYVSLYLRTAEIIREEVPAARMYALSLARPYNTEYTEYFLKALQAEDKLHLVDEITFHGYLKNPSFAYTKLKLLREVVDRYDPGILLHQGEQGAPSTYIETGALKKYPWTEASQAKWALRRLLGDLGNGYQTLYFTMIDVYYGNNTDTHIKKLNTKGLLASDETLQVKHIKPSYYAVQNLCSVMDSSFVSKGQPGYSITIDSAYSVYHFEQKDTGYNMIAAWISQKIPADTSAYIPIDLTLERVALQDPVMIDLLSGNVFDIAASKIEREAGQITFANLPLYDAPILLAEKALVRIIPDNQ